MSELKGHILKNGIYLVLEPQYSHIDNQLVEFLIGIYNNTSKILQADISIKFNDSDDIDTASLELESNDWVEFSEMNLFEFNNGPQLNFEIFFPDTNKSISKRIKPKAKHVSKIAPKIAQLDANVYCIPLWYPEVKKKTQKSELKFDTRSLREALLETKSVPDLIDIEHCGEEVDIHADKMGLSSIDISTGALDYQLTAFEQGLDSAIANGLHSFLVIHGRGAGILRKEVHRRLRTNKQIKRFSLCNDSGATLIEI